jgi:hypothetical protein
MEPVAVRVTSGRDFFFAGGFDMVFGVFFGLSVRGAGFDSIFAAGVTICLDIASSISLRPT